MATILYPPSLPQTPLLSGYQEILADNLVRNQMDTGPPQTRPKSTAPRKQITWPMVLSQAQKTALISFFEDDLSFGSSEFQHTLGDDVNQVVFYKFQGPPKFSSLGGDQWKVTLDLELIRLVP